MENGVNGLDAIMVEADAFNFTVPVAKRSFSGEFLIMPQVMMDPSIHVLCQKEASEYCSTGQIEEYCITVYYIMRLSVSRYEILF